MGTVSIGNLEGRQKTARQTDRYEAYSQTNGQKGGVGDRQEMQAGRKTYTYRQTVRQEVRYSERRGWERSGNTCWKIDRKRTDSQSYGQKGVFVDGYGRHWQTGKKSFNRETDIWKSR